MATLLRASNLADNGVKPGDIVRSIVVVAAILALFPLAPLPALEKSLTLGGSESWQGIESAEGVAYRTGYEGRLDLTLADAEYQPTPETDLLLHFDGQNGSEPADAAGNYELRSSSIAFSRRLSVLGGAAGLFTGQRRALVLAPSSPDALFQPGRQWHDFSIEFWLYAADLSEGQTLLLWQNGRLAAGRLLPQELRASLVAGHLDWTFRNFFVPPSAGSFDLRLSGRAFLVPREWYHCLLRFDSNTGMVESSIDGAPDSIGYANDSGSENGSVYSPFTGTAEESRLVVGDRFNGLLDELRISRSFARPATAERYSSRPGVALTKILDLGYPDTIVPSITVHDRKPGNTDVYFFYKTANLKTSDTELPGEWTQFAPGASLASPPKGRYIQIKVELLPDGTGTVSPSLSWITLSYRPHLPPPAPALLTAQPQDGAIALSWRAVVDPDLSGYRIYYGARPDQYFGTDSSSGPSPIDVGNTTSFTLKGLTNGRLYYIAVVAYDATQPREQGGFSNEVAARPSRLYGTGP